MKSNKKWAVLSDLTTTGRSRKYWWETLVVIEIVSSLVVVEGFLL